ALRAGLRDFGYVEGQNLAIEYRFALGQTKSYDELAQELVSLDPAAIVLTGTPAALALKRQTTTIPIILAPIADPIALGLARSLSRPGGNVTGVTMYGTELAHKRMEILREAAAGIRRVAVLVNAENPLHPFLWDDIQPIGPLLGLEFRLFAVSDFNELPTMFSIMARDGFDALTFFSDAQFFSVRRRIGELAAMHRFPAMYESRDFVDDGGLSYEIRVGDQPQDRPRARPRNSADATSPRRRGDRMKRRDFITLLGGAAAAWPLAARAQQVERMRRIGVLIQVAEGNPQARIEVAAFLRSLQE